MSELIIAVSNMSKVGLAVLYFLSINSLLMMLVLFESWRTLRACRGRQEQFIKYREALKNDRCGVDG